MVEVKVEGLRALENALRELPKATAANVLRRTLRKAAAPVEKAMRSRAPRLTGVLEHSIITGTKLNKRQARFARKEGKGFAEIYVGTADPAGVPQEFGTFKEEAQPFARPGWEASQDEALLIIEEELGGEIEKARARLARKAL
jgi:HK97 gp10 family phage protein